MEAEFATILEAMIFTMTEVPDIWGMKTFNTAFHGKVAQRLRQGPNLRKLPC